MQIRYEVGGAELLEHRARFALDLREVDAPTVDVVLPSWVPGSYHIVNYVRGIERLTAHRSTDHAALPVERVDKARWRVTTGGASAIEVAYSVYGHELVTEGVDITPDHIFLNAALCLPYIDGHQSEPIELTLHVPSGWRVITELPPLGLEPPRFRAQNYDELVDSPLDVGRPLVLTIRPSGIPHRIALCGEGGNYEAHRLEEDIGKIVDATVRMLGDSPLSGYTFFYHLTDVPDGGLEHATSCSCVVHRNCFEPAERYERFLSLTSHEYFHLYNVKRIRPKVLGSFDYTRENYTRLLWWMEGTTDYFSEVVLRRAGLVSTPKFLERMGKFVKEFLTTPGRRTKSLEDESYVAWVDYYQPYEETPNHSVSYYLKGLLVSMCLDIEIRHRTEARASLETVLRALWTEYGKTGRGVEEDALLGVANRATGLDLAPFFARYVQGTDEIDFDAFARLAGLSFGPKPKPPGEETPEPGYLGIRYEDAGGIVRVRNVLSETPGRRAGLSPGDEIIAINGAKVTHTGFDKSLLGYPPGTPVELSVFRRGYLHPVPLTMGKSPPEAYVFTPVEGASDLARRVHESWLGTKWEPASKPDAVGKA
jgi:predicted metalloprotease with PDZ domain